MSELREAHAHIALHGRSSSFVDLAPCSSASEALECLASAAAELDVSQWVIAVGARPEGWEVPGWFAPAELKSAVGGRPAFVWCFDHHAGMASPAGLAAAGIAGPTPDPAGGTFLRDPSGEPTGVALEAAAHAIWSAVPEPTAGEWREHVRRGLADFVRCGFTGVHELHAPPWLGPMLAELADAGELPVDVTLFEPVADIAAAVDRARSWQRDNLRLGGGKIFADGTLNSRTAWMLSPYADPVPGHPTGHALWTVDAIAEAATRCAALGVGLACHAIGDGAVRAVLDAYEQARVPADRSFRVEHAELLDEADVPRFAAMGAVCSVQPCHLLTDIEALRRLVPDRLDRVLPLRELIDAGCAPGELLWFGSDAPIVRPDPQDSIDAATLRRRPGMPAEDSIAQSQALTEAEAWAAFARD